MKNFHDLMVERISRISVSNSTFPFQTKVLKDARTYLGNISLPNFFKNLTDKDENKFKYYLRRQTTEFKRKYKPTITFGIARKSLNLFYREVVYNVYLCKEYKFSTFSKKNKTLLSRLEIPVDRSVIKCLRCNKVVDKIGSNKLEEFKFINIRDLDWRNNDKIQKNALEYAKIEKTSRINLDLIFWRNSKDKCDDCPL